MSENLILSLVKNTIKAVCNGILDEFNLTRKEMCDTLEELADYFRY